MEDKDLKLKFESLKTALLGYKTNFSKCMFEYIWNSFDAKATEVHIKFDEKGPILNKIDDFIIEDNGSGWEFGEINAKSFLTSDKTIKENNKSLPRGKLGRGRYVFIWFANNIEIFSKNKKLKLEINNIIVDPVQDNSAPKVGTKIKFNQISHDFSDFILDKENLYKEILYEFCWFLKENPKYAIYLNNTKINYNDNVEKEETLHKNSFDKNIQKYLDPDFSVNIVLWKKRPLEYSKYYLLNSDGLELYTQNTGLNKKNDDFWHSVYIKSKIFKSIVDDEVEDNDLFNDDVKKIKKQIKDFIKKRLVLLRKPYLEERSKSIVKELKEKNAYPNLNEFGIYDTDGFETLIKLAYRISPSLFVGKSLDERKFVCASFAGLLSSQDNNLILKILEQVETLSKEERKDLFEILSKTNLSNIVKTIKEIEHRIQVVDDLEKLVFDFQKETLEVKHLQKILNNEFWIFGEEYKLFSNTEGALKNTLNNFAKKILKIDVPNILTKSRKEVDIFLTKTINERVDSVQNIVVEIKRPSIKLGKKEYDQIENYCNTILNESSCNGNNIYWKFLLIGDSCDEYIEEKINQLEPYGEKNKGLIYKHSKLNAKIYVRKWSDILVAEWGYRLKKLKESLEIKRKETEETSVDDIISRY